MGQKYDQEETEGPREIGECEFLMDPVCKLCDLFQPGIYQQPGFRREKDYKCLHWYKIGSNRANLWKDSKVRKLKDDATKRVVNSETVKKF